MKNLPFKPEDLFNFLDEADKATWAAGAPEVRPERTGFHELAYKKGDFDYRDSYTGHYRSRGMTVVRFKGKPIYASLYGGGMAKGKEDLTNKTFNFLKKCLSSDEKGFESHRGPHNLKDGEWEYRYSQEGDTEEFSGYEEIYYKGELVFFHRIFGGLII